MSGNNHIKLITSPECAAFIHLCKYVYCIEFIIIIIILVALHPSDSSTSSCVIAYCAMYCYTHNTHAHHIKEPNQIYNYDLQINPPASPHQKGCVSVQLGRHIHPDNDDDDNDDDIE